MCRESKSSLLQVTLNFELEQMNISSRHSNSNFGHSFEFHRLTNFCKKCQFVVDDFSCELLCTLSIYTLKSDQWIPIW